MENLVEKYARKISIAEAYYKKNHDGKSLDNARRIATAVCLENTSKLLEAFDANTATQFGNVDSFKRFALTLTTLAVPDTIVFDLMMVKPMTSRAGYVTYLKLVYGSNKGQVNAGDVAQTSIGGFKKTDANYTSQAVVENVEGAGEVTLIWTPVVKNAFGAGQDVKFVDAATGAVSYLVETDNKVTVPGAGKIAYVYDNVLIPQNDLPTLTLETASIALTAKARRIAIRYSQLAAIDAKTTMGVDIQDELTTQAIAEINYEVNNEGINLLNDAAVEDASLTFSKTAPYGVSLQEHYNAFVAKLTAAQQIIYKRTKKYSPNYMVCAPDVIEVLALNNTFKPTGAEEHNGPYFAGTINGLKVFVSAELADGRYFLGVNNGDVSAAIYAPYIEIIPTQLLGFADSSMEQGFSCMYDMQLLNGELLISGKITA